MEKKKNTIYTQYVYFHTLKILKAFPSSSMCAVRKKKKSKQEISSGYLLTLSDQHIWVQFSYV